MAGNDGSNTPLTMSDLNTPFGVPQLDGNGDLPQKIVGDAASARVNGVPLAYILPAFSSDGSSGEYIPISAIGKAGGVASLDTAGSLVAPLTAAALTSSFVTLANSLPVKDPHVVGSLWNNKGIITISMG